MHENPLVAPATQACTVESRHSPAVTVLRRFASDPRVAGLAWFAAIAVQFALIVLLIFEFHLESRTFGRLMQLALAGFVVHHFLPLRLKLYFFGGLSLAATVAITGPTPGATLIGIGLALIGICHAPVRIQYRAAMLLAVGVALGVFCANSNWFPPMAGVWTLVGSMFAFRIIIYLYDLHHRAAPFSPAHAIAYFFMIPNVCFPLFPLVDYKTFCATRFNEPENRIYQVGVEWMFRGVVQLLLYRLVYQYGVMDIADVSTSVDVARYMVATYLLYLHVSGQFHLIVGLLHMFGFNLPETHHRYLLASSFTDFWRRINIYWKDFIMKIFFYPAFFAWRGLGPLKALSLATIAAFGATWLLHSCQWFWFRGTFLVTWQDVAFWAILGVLVLVNALLEAVGGRRRSLSKPRFDLKARLKLGLKTAATFVAICALWTLWSCQSFDELQILADSATRVSPSGAAILVAGLAALITAAMLWGSSVRESSEGLSTAAASIRPFRFWRSAAAVTCSAAALLVLPLFGAERFPRAESLLAALREDHINTRDLDAQQRGYYEELDVARSIYTSWGDSFTQPDGWNQGDATRARNDFIKRELKPSASVVMSGAPFTTNHWGFRDREYDKHKPANVYRIALIGSSHELGAGVRDDETFENLVEERLRREPPGPQAPRIEILNFSTGGYSALQAVARIEEFVFDFEPDAVILAVNPVEPSFLAYHLAQAATSQWSIPFDFVTDVFQRANVGPHQTKLINFRRLKPFVPELLEGAFRRFREDCLARGIRPLMMYRPPPMRPSRTDQMHLAELLESAERCGQPVLDLSPAYEGVEDYKTLMIAPWDRHTTVLGHRLLADELYNQLVPLLPTSMRQE